MDFNIQDSHMKDSKWLKVTSHLIYSGKKHSSHTQLTADVPPLLTLQETSFQNILSCAIILIID